MSSALPPAPLASAPGKLFLFGEYAALACGWSVVAAVDRRITAQRDPHATAYTVLGADFGGDDALPRTAARAAHLDPELVARLRVDVTALYERGDKLGLGSSAASTIAALLAIAPSLLDDPQTLFCAAFDAHREIQRGRGSGADIASALWGGVLGYRLAAPQQPFPQLEALTAPDCMSDDHGPALITPPLMLPDALRVEPVWLGAPASSTQLVGQVERALHSTSTRASLLHVLGAISDGAAAAISTLHGADRARMSSERAAIILLDLVQQADALMQELHVLTGAAIITPAHEALRAIAARHGAHCKTSGAGGGDLSLLCGPRSLRWDTLLEAVTSGGLRPVALQLGSPGARVVTPSSIIGSTSA